MDEFPSPPVINPVEQQTKLHRNAIIWLVIGWMVLLTLTAGAIYFYSIGFRSNPTSSSGNPTGSAQKLSATPIVENKKQHYVIASQRISFDYPSDWVVTNTNMSYQTKTCDTASDDVFGDCELSDTVPTGAFSYGQLLTLRPQSSMKDTYYPNPAIQLLYYDNPENLSIQDYNAKYLSRPVAGDPVSIWSESYATVSNANGVTAFYDADHYCVAVCQVYVFSGKGRIFMLKNFPTDVPNQLDIFKAIFFSLSV